MHEQLYRDIFETELTHWWAKARRHILASMLRYFAPPDRPLRIADVGCGMGSTFEMLSEFGWVVGVDLSPTALAFSKQRGHPLLIAGSLPSLPFADATFDVVCALDIIEHLDDDHAAARELWRICKPGGLLLVTVPAYEWLWSEHDSINEHRRRYTRHRLQEVFEHLPLEYLKLSYMNTLLAPPVMLIRLLNKIFHKTSNTSTELKSDVYSVWPPLNTALTNIFASEAVWLKKGSFPFGISAICVARKPKRPAEITHAH